jgi:hypothetical protein
MNLRNSFGLWNSDCEQGGEDRHLAFCGAIHHKRRPPADFSDEGLVNFSLSDYFLQHLLGQHFPLPWQQSAAGDVAVAVPMNAAKVATKRRYFIRSSS